METPKLLAKTATDLPEAASRANRQCTVLLSGGIDSAACVGLYREQQFAVNGIHISYGQVPAAREVAAARSVASHYAVPLKVVRLVGGHLKTPGELLGRNAFLLFSALMELEERSSLLALGIHSGTPYYDSSPRFLASVQALVDGQCDGRIRVVAPFLEWTKRDIWDYCIEHAVPIDLTYSCERGSSQPCGDCLSCRDLEALRACQKLHTSA